MNKYDKITKRIYEIIYKIEDITIISDKYDSTIRLELNKFYIPDNPVDEVNKIKNIIVKQLSDKFDIEQDTEYTYIIDKCYMLDFSYNDYLEDSDIIGIYGGISYLNDEDYSKYQEYLKKNNLTESKTTYCDYMRATTNTCIEIEVYKLD